MVKRLFDLTLLTIILIPSLIISAVIAVVLKLNCDGPVIYWSTRIGKNREVFLIPKFRSMATDTPTLPKHEMKEPSQYITPIGKFLRRTSLDELPQLWSILRGQMSFIGPRPVLENHYDVIKYRDQYGVNQLLPGLTGWAQINGRDYITDEEKVVLDAYYLNNHSLWLDIKIIIITVWIVLTGKYFSH